MIGSIAGQRRHLVAGQDPPDGGGDQAELAGEEHRAAVALGAQRQDLGLDLGAVRVGVVCGREERSSSPASPSAW